MQNAEEGNAHTPSSVSFRIGGLASVSLGFRAGCGWVFEGGGGVVCGALQIPQPAQMVRSGLTSRVKEEWQGNNATMDKMVGG